MNKIIGATLLITCFAFNACADNEPDHDSALESEAAKITAGKDSQTVKTPDTTAAIQQITPTGQPLTAPAIQQTVTPATATAPGMNPAHGQPGHRCDIAVGAPLNSAPTKPAVMTTTASPTVTPTAQPASTAKTVTAPGMNPPHGEPGHRCDIAVGAPLNSAPTKPATQTITPTVVPSPTVVPAKKDSAGS